MWPCQNLATRLFPLYEGQAIKWRPGVAVWAGFLSV